MPDRKSKEIITLNESVSPIFLTLFLIYFANIRRNTEKTKFIAKIIK
jgi:hypothetical protein